MSNFNEPKTLFIDMDGVMINTIEAMCTYYNETVGFSNPVYSWQINTWGFEELEKFQKGYVYKLFKKQAFFDEVRFFGGCIAFLKGLNYCNWRIKVVTMGCPINLALKKEFLQKHLPFCEFIGVNTNHFKDKSHIDMSGENVFYLEDVEKNLLFSNCENKIIFGVKKPWNENWKGDWVQDYDELEMYFKMKGLM